MAAEPKEVANPELGLRTPPNPVVHSPTSNNVPKPQGDPDKLVLYGLVSGICVSTIVMLASLVIVAVLIWKVLGTGASALELQITVNAIGCFIALSFASMGYCLFLINAKGEFDGAYEGESSNASKIKATVKATAPGLIVFICATIIMCVVLSRPWHTESPLGNTPKEAPLPPYLGNKK